MILRMPSYYKNFKCTAERCSDNCCIGWEIDIDEKTADFYNSVTGVLGEKLKKNITAQTPKSFILGDNERCPFLNEENLCDLILNLGEDKLCEICTEHPRYYEWYAELKEGGVGLCCEAAAELILTQNEPFTFIETKIDVESHDEYDVELFNCLFEARNKILSYLQIKNMNLNKKVCAILDYAELLQFQVDNNNFSVPDIKYDNSCSNSNLKQILEYLLALEPIDDNWKPYINSKIEMFDEVRKFKSEFIKGNPEVQKYLQNIAIYFIWRHFLKCTFEGEFLSIVKLMAIYIAVIGYAFACKWYEGKELSLQDCIEISKYFSKEIEYSEENMSSLADMAYEKSTLETLSIKGLFQ